TSQSGNTSIAPNNFSGYQIAAAQVNLGQLVFVPATDRFTALTQMVGFRVQDDGNVLIGAGGGQNVSVADNSLSIAVTAVNDPPVGTNKTLTIPEDTTYTFSNTGTTDFGFTDP